MGESKVKSENFITIQGWMITDLKLKGNELIVYASIYGFTQAENQVFSGSLQYLADWTNSTKQGVSKNLKSLVEKGFVIKNEKYINGVKFCEYHTTKLNRVLNKVDGGIKQSLIGGMQQSLTNNIVLDNIDNNIDNKKGRKSFIPPTLEDVKEYCKKRNNNVNPNKFYDFYNEGNWEDSKGNKVKNWKQKIITWENRDNNVSNTYKRTEIVPEWLDKEIKPKKANEEEQKEMDDLLKDYQNP